jgi:Ca-activated chloride channel homolog
MNGASADSFTRRGTCLAGRAHVISGFSVPPMFLRRALNTIVILGCVSLAASNGTGHAQEAIFHAPRNQPTFTTGVDLVALSVTVTDHRQRYVAGLSSAEFQIFEDGVPQEVTYFSASETPLDVAILLDSSASMTDKMALARSAALGLLQSLHQGDRAAVLDLKDTVNVRQPFTTDFEKLTAAVRATRSSGGTALYNGIYVALKQFATLEKHTDVRRQAIVVLSDGDDTVSLLTFDDVLDLAKRTGVAVYTVSLKSKFPTPLVLTAQNRSAGNDYSMKSLAQETGGRSFFPPDATALPAVYRSIAEELANQYALGYAPKNSSLDGAYRKVVVRVTRADATPRTRTGYFAERMTRSVFAGGGQPNH